MTTASPGILRGTSLLALAWLLCPTPFQAAAAAPARPNVLFIMADDLNHWVGYTGRNKQELAGVIQELAGWLPKENKAGLKRSAGGLEEGERPEPKEDRAAKRRARWEKSSP